jgi:hypothetical protein
MPGEERLRHGLDGVGVCQGNEMAVFAEAVDDGQDHRLFVYPWESFHKVQPNVRPNGGWNGQRQ